MNAIQRFKPLATSAILIVVIGCSQSDTSTMDATPIDEPSDSPWTTIGEYDAGIVTSKSSADGGGTDFVASKHFFGAMIKYVCQQYDCTVKIDPPTIASKPLDLTVTGDSAETVLRAIADACDLQLTVGENAQFVLIGDGASGDSGRLIAADTFPPWWDQ